jgi:4'-phosphopantetheinyl transferase EntD
MAAVTEVSPSSLAEIDAEARGLAWIFGALPVLVEEQRLGTEPPAVHPLEAADVAAAVLRRRVEFATGRACARRALARLGVGGFVLRNGSDRAPRWPEGVVGSITHTGDVPGGTCAVAVASTRDVLALGLDAETGASLSPELWPDVLTPSERRWLNGAPEASRSRLARLAFSAKECFFKAQFPRTRRFLAFEDVEISVDVSASAFEARVVRGAPGGPEGPEGPFMECRGRYLDGADLVLTGIAVPA